MPGLDRTGPEGKGSRTGRQMGKCNPQRGEAINNPEDKSMPGRRNAGRYSENDDHLGRRYRQGLGRGGFGRRNRGKA